MYAVIMNTALLPHCVFNTNDQWLHYEYMMKLMTNFNPTSILHNKAHKDLHYIYPNIQDFSWIIFVFVCIWLTLL